MKKSLKIFFPILFIAVIISACEKNENLNNTKIPAHLSLTTDQSTSIQSTNRLSFAILKGLRQNSEEIAQNQVVSSTSLGMMLAMCANGADGDTQAQILKTLGFDDLNDVQIMFSKLNHELPKLDKAVTLDINNSFWYRDDLNPNMDYVQDLAKFYNSDIHGFQQGKFSDGVNNWIEEKVNGLIKDFVSEGQEPEWSIVNTLYFKAPWKNKFNKKNTRNDIFTCEDKTQSSVPFMSMSKTVSCGENGSFDMISLPFGQGTYEMAFILPKEGNSIDDVLEHLCAEEWGSVIEKLDMVRVSFTIPKFKVEKKDNYGGILEQLGISAAFSKDANFSPMGNGFGLMGDVMQAVSIEIDETGAEAAVVSGNLSVTAPERPKSLDFNRPFIYVIYEHFNKCVILTGMISSL